MTYMSNVKKIQKEYIIAFVLFKEVRIVVGTVYDLPQSVRLWQLWPYLLAESFYEFKAPAVTAKQLRTA